MSSRGKKIFCITVLALICMMEETPSHIKLKPQSTEDNSQDKEPQRFFYIIYKGEEKKVCVS